MARWIDGFQESIDFIEANLNEDLKVEEIATKAGLSPFYYQRFFGTLCGITVGEYILKRILIIDLVFIGRLIRKLLI